MPQAPLALLALAATASGGPVRVLDLRPAVQGSCPGDLLLATGSGGGQLCTRAAHPVTSLVINASNLMAAAAHPKGLGVYDRLTGSIEAYQKGTPEAFEPGIRDSSSLDSSDYVDGLSITVGSPRRHVFTLSVGGSYDTNLGTGLCPCGPTAQTLVCGAALAPTFVGGDFACDSGNFGSLGFGWEPRAMVVHFDMALPASADEVEVRFMCDQPANNEDVGVAALQLDVHEVEDLDPPVLQLIGGQTLSVPFDEPFNDPGATCLDAVDGQFMAAINGTVDLGTLGLQSVEYRCEDTRGNVALAMRTVLVLDNTAPQVIVRAGERQCVVTGDAYAELGAECRDDFDAPFEANITGQVDTATLGTYWMTYSCTDISGNVATAMSRVLVISSASPGSLLVVNVELQTHPDGPYTAAGARSHLTNVHPKTDLRLHWSAAFELGTEGCRFITFFERGPQGPVLVKRYEGVLLNATESERGRLLSIAQGSDPLLSAGLRDRTTYMIVVDEHFLQDAAGGGGNARQVISFTTGDYTGPQLVGTAPASHELSFPTSQAITLTFDEHVQAASGKDIRVRFAESGAVESVPCNGSLSPSGTSFRLDGRQATASLSSWELWQGCKEYEIEADAGCFLDTSVNHNPSATMDPQRFLTSCVVDLSPAHGSIGVPMTSPVVLSFAEPVQMGAGAVELQPLGEDVLALGAQDFPRLYVRGSSLTLDLACQTDVCRIHAAHGGTNTSAADTALGLCAGRALQQCRGKPHVLRLGAGALRLARGPWPETSLLNGTDDLPPQLQPSSGAYSFTLQPVDLTPPSFVHLEMAATAGDSLRVTARLDEGGMVHCAAFRNGDGEPCGTLALMNESSESEGRCANETREDCANCSLPSYGCLSRTEMWVRNGCAGLFGLDGRDVECESWELEATTYDGGTRSVLSLGHRHACAIRKNANDASVRCWGKADNIEPLLGPLPVDELHSVAAGHMHTCGTRMSTREVLCWGHDLHGETGGLDDTNGSVAFASITSGYQFSCGLRVDDGEAECWGLNDVGQASPPRGVAFLAISAGNRHVCGIRASDTTVQCWGWNNYGQSSPPAGVAFLSRGPAGTPLPEMSISSGWHHTCGVRAADSKVQCWGSNADGQSAAPTDGRTFVGVAAGRAHSCGLHKTPPGFGTRAEGTASCWGLNDFGQALVPAGIRLSALAADDDYTCGIVLEDSSLRCWGKDDYGQAQPPMGARFGALDEFAHVVCSTDALPSKQQILALNGPREAGASVAAPYSVIGGYSEAVLHLRGLVGNTNYWVYCFAEDDELPTPNTMSEQQMRATGRLLRTLDLAPPDIQAIQTMARGTDAVSVEVHLSEPGVAYCAAVSDRDAAITGQEIAAFGSYGATRADLTAPVTISGLAADTEFRVYCTAHDRAGTHPDASRADNWAPDHAVIASRVNVHTVFDGTPPSLLSVLPAHNGFFSCLPDGFDPGCMTSVELAFSEDVRRGSGNLTLQCLTNLGSCMDVAVPLEAPNFDGGSTSLQNRVLRVTFSSPLQDASTYKVVVSRGAVQDKAGNAFEMDVQCESWFDARWQAALGPCAPSYVLKTPS